MLFMTLIKLLVIAAVLIILRILFPTLVKGFKRILFKILARLIIKANTNNY